MATKQKQMNGKIRNGCFVIILHSLFVSAAVASASASVVLVGSAQIFVLFENVIMFPFPFCFFEFMRELHFQH